MVGWLEKMFAKSNGGEIKFWVFSFLFLLWKQIEIIFFFYRNITHSKNQKNRKTKIETAIETFEERAKQNKKKI